jgi:hypothetical protein
MQLDVNRLELNVELDETVCVCGPFYHPYSEIKGVVVIITPNLMQIKSPVNLIRRSILLPLIVEKRKTKIKRKP